MLNKNILIDDDTMNKNSIYEQRKRDRVRLLKIKEVIGEVEGKIKIIKNITSQIKDEQPKNNISK